MDKIKKFKDYNVVIEFDIFLIIFIYYILGYKSDLKDQLYVMYVNYNKEGVFLKSDIFFIKKVLKEKNVLF